MTRDHFIEFLVGVRSPAFVGSLDALHAQAQANFLANDWIWTALITSVATLQGVPDMAALHKQQAKWNWLAIEGLGDHQLIERIYQVYLNSGVRQAERKSKWFAWNRQYIITHGGPQQYHQIFANQNLHRAIHMLREFQGIGAKYSRNIGLDAADERFENCIAIDSRLMKIANRVAGVPATRFNAADDPSYTEWEDWFLGVAQELEITGWQLDRTLFWLSDPLGLFEAAHAAADDEVN